ncbi:MAG TPA: hypothetical protein VHR39_19790 [Propionibacteriaceae bacterium]|nr:hypothetical protein [Propionibacteriaceae bacterium]
MSRQGMDADSAETLAGVVRFLRRAAELVWAAVDAEGGVASTSARVGHRPSRGRRAEPPTDAIPVDGPVLVGDDPAGLLRSAEQLLRRVTTPRAGIGLHALRRQVAGLVWEANTGVDG